MPSNGAPSMRGVARNIGRRFSICSSKETRCGRKTQRFWLFLFPESFSITKTNRRLRIRTTREQHGRISRCRAFVRGWWCMGWKDSITSAHAKNSGYPMSFKSKQWPLSENPGRKNYFLESCKPAKAQTIAANFPRAFSKDRFGLANDVCKIFWHLIIIVVYERKHALSQI